jgi:tetratricopeptide (TPR) repeat protein
MLMHASRIQDRRSAAEALSELGQSASAAIPALLQSIAAQDQALREAALDALDAIEPDWRGHPAVQEVLGFWAKTLRRGRLKLNHFLAKQIAKIGEAVVPGLAQAVADAGDVVGNVFVLRVLGRLGPSAAGAVPEIARALGSEYSQVRIAAANALEEIGPAASAAIPALRASRSHWNADVRRAVARCLARIDPAAEMAAKMAKPPQRTIGRPDGSEMVARAGTPGRPASPADLPAVLGKIMQLRQLSDMSERVSLCEQALALASRETDPMLWASLQNELAMSLASSTGGVPAKNMERAIHHFEQALGVYTRQACPEEWAMVQNNLCSTYRKRVSGERAENIERAIACAEKALEVRTREADPEGWATSHNNLGNAYRDRILGDRAENLEETVRHCRLALEGFSRQSNPWKWATAHNNLANAYQDRLGGERAENLEQAIHHYLEALKVFTRQASAEDWAWTHSNLGAAYHGRVRGDRAKNIEESIRYSNRALKVYTPESIPEEWAATHLNLGNAYRDRVYGESAENLEKALGHYQQALQVFTSDRYPQRWAKIQEQLSGAGVEGSGQAAPSTDSGAAYGPILTYAQFYEEESRLQPGEKRELRLVFSKAPETRIEANLILVYQWDVELPEQEAKRLALRAVAYISCAIYDAARIAGLPCQPSPIANGRRPAWLIAGERVPVSLTISDVEVSQRACQMSVGPMIFFVDELPGNVSLLARLLQGFTARFGTIRV